MKTTDIEDNIFRLFRDFEHVSHSVSVGKKTVNGEPTKADAIVFYVEKKKPYEEISKEDLVPDIVVMDGEYWLTDVVETSPFYFSADVPGCSGVDLNTWNSRHNAEAARCGVSIGCQKGLPSNSDEARGTLGHICLDKYDNTFCGITAGHVLAYNQFFTGAYKKLQENDTEIHNDNIFSDNQTCPVIPVHRPSTGGAELGPIKRYYPLRTRPAVNQVDVGMLAITNKNQMPLDGWHQLNLVLHEDIKSVTLDPVTTGLAENHETLATLEQQFCTDIEIEYGDFRNYNVYLTGKDSKYFTVVYPTVDGNGNKPGNPKLYFSPSVLANKEAKETYTVNVCVEDKNSITRLATEVAYHPFTNLPYSTAAPICNEFVLTLLDKNDPALFSLGEKTFNIPEDAPVNLGVELTTITINDIDTLGTNVLRLRGPDASLFMIVGSSEAVDGSIPAQKDPSYGQEYVVPHGQTAKLWLKPNDTPLNYEVRDTLSVVVYNEDLQALAATGPTFVDVKVYITDVNEFPTDLILSPTTKTLTETDFYISTSEISQTIHDIKLADIYWSEVNDEAPEAHIIGLDGPFKDYFLIKQTGYEAPALYLKSGFVLDYEQLSQMSVNVVLLDASFPATQFLAETFTLNISNIPDPIYGMTLNKTTIGANGIEENVLISTDVELGTFAFLDQDPETHTYYIVGDYSYLFKIENNKLYFLGAAGGVTLDYEWIPQYNIRIYAFDQHIGGSFPLYVDYTLQVIDDDELGDPDPDVGDPFPMPRISETSATTSINEYANTAGAIELANYSISFPVVPDPLTNGIDYSDFSVSIEGPDKNDFVLQNITNTGFTLSLRAGTELRYEAQERYNVIVAIEYNGNPVHSIPYALWVYNTNRHPTAVQILHPRTSIREDAYSWVNLTPTQVYIPCGFISIVDDNDGTVETYLEPIAGFPDDTDKFEIIGGILYLKPGVVLDHETQEVYRIRVVAIDNSVNHPYVYADYSLNIIDANDSPTAIAFDPSQPKIVSIPEDTNLDNALLLGKLKIEDADQEPVFKEGNEVILYGFDAVNFSLEQIGEAWELYLKAGTVLDQNIKPSYSIFVCVMDTSSSAIGSTPICITYTLNITEAPKVRYLRFVAGSTPQTTIRAGTTGEIARIEGVSENGTVQCGKYSIEAGDGSSDYAGMFSITQGDCVSQAIISIMPGVNIDFWAQSKYYLKIKCEQEKGPDVFMDYVIDVQQPYLVYATAVEIESLKIGDRVWYCGAGSGFMGQDACPLVIKGIDTALTISPPSASFSKPHESYYYNRTLSQNDSRLDFQSCILFGYKFGSDIVVRPKDSGSALLAVFGGVIKIIGIVFAAGDNYGVACRADLVADLMDVAIDDNHITDDPNILYTADSSYTDPEKWRYLYTDRLTYNYRRKLCEGLDTAGQPIETIFYQVGVFKDPPAAGT